MKITEFIAGCIYMDTPKIETWTTVLQFVALRDGKYIFQYYCGAKTYFEDDNGYIPLPRGDFFPDMYRYSETIN